MAQRLLILVALSTAMPFAAYAAHQGWPGVHTTATENLESYGTRCSDELLTQAHPEPSLVEDRKPGGAETRLTAHPQQLLTTDPADFARLLATARPTPLSANARSVILRSLPTEGEVTRLDAHALRKLSAMREVLRTTSREASLEVRIIDVKQATVGLYARTVLLVSKHALDLLRAEELQALVAHEIGHEYVWADYERASKLGDIGRAKELELLCDAIGIVVLHQLGINPSSLIAGVEKIERFNRDKLGVAANQDAYPTPAQRRAFARAVRQWLAAGPNAYDAVVTRALRLLPREPDKIVVIERGEGCHAGQPLVQACVTVGSRVVSLVRQGATMQLALKGPGIFDYILAAIIWHEMAHIDGADEGAAQEAEERLWRQFLLAGRVDGDAGMRYLHLLTKRRSVAP